MKANPVHSVLGFYAADDEEAKKAFTALRHPKIGEVCLLRGGETPEGAVGRNCAQYEGLRLEGESLLVVTAPRDKTQLLVRKLRETGSPAIFVLTEGAVWLNSPEAAPASQENETLADRVRKCAGRRGRPSFARSRIVECLREYEDTLNEARRELLEAARLEHSLTSAAEWILDNAYLIRTQVAEIARHLPKEHHKILPAGASGHPYIYELATELVAHTDYSLNEANIQEALREYQKTAPLTIAELWSFSLLLRMALIEGLAHLAGRVCRAQELREAAYFWANRLASAARRGPEEFDRMLHLMEAEPAAPEPYFVTSLAEQLQDEEDALAPVQHWIEERRKTPLIEMVRAEHNREAGEAVSTANAFGSLRTISRIDFTEIFESVSLIEAELRTDPGGVYPRSDFPTRDHCRQVVEKISRCSGAGELDVARRAVALAARATDSRAGHVAYYLLDNGVTQLEAETHARIPVQTRMVRALRRHATPIYIGSVIILTLCFTALALALAWDTGVRQQAMLAALGLLALFPLSEFSIQIVNALIISLLPPDTLPKLAFAKEGIPPEHATLVTIPMMLSNAEVVRREVEKLEIRFLANREKNLFFSLFSDFTDALEPSVPGDEELLAVARDGIAGLNARYPGGHFLLFHRPRVWSESEQRWIGWERKRGKLDELNAFLCGENQSDLIRVGSLPLPIQYVITLDADTQLPPGAARRMVETIAYPLNRVEIDPVTRVRRRGFAIIQPRVSITLPAATATRFTRIFADTSGTDPYCQTVSDAQQDLFGEAIFHGKAIYDVKAFCTILRTRFPDETLLSHDLLEGSHAGVGLATDIELFENLPLDYVSFSQRQHRWIRGDWQIAPWMGPRVPSASGKERLPNPLPAIGRWRIFDNLRRSLVPVASLLLLVFGWLISAAPGVWSLVVGLAIAIPAVAPLLDRLARRMQGVVDGSLRGAADELVRAAVMVAFLPHQAWLAIDAIVRVIYRSRVSHRNLLEWQTAESAGVYARNRKRSILQQMWIICGLSLTLTIVLLVQRSFGPTVMFIALWAAAPALVLWLDLPAPVGDRHKLGPENLYLRRLGRETWRYFDDLVGPESHWLPPDNSQLALRVEVAERTSPTNIGLWLTSALAARDLGYISADDLLRRSTATMATIGGLERYEGHLLNWYDTRTLTPLAPRYVSTVDSGNLLASLWVLAQGCGEVIRSPIIGQSCTRGISDTLTIIHRVCGREPSIAAPLHALRRLLRVKIEGHALIGRLRLAANLAQQLHDAGRWQDSASEQSYWTNNLFIQVRSWTDTLNRYLVWMETLAQPPDSFLRALGDDAIALRRRALHVAPSLLTLANGGIVAIEMLLSRRGESGVPREVSAWLDQLAAEYLQARANAAETVKGFESLANTATGMAAGIKMDFLYDSQRRLFGVGYVVGGPREFASHYDLLASECRVASLVAIAKGDVPIEHWAALGRPHAPSDGGEALLSWSGTMFEYLMPLLFTRTFTNSLLDQACEAAVQKQIDYGREKDAPWGISESAYAALDANQIYQYRAFGVPALALKQGIEEDFVVAPYASALALLVDPQAATENLQRLEEIGLAGPMGLYEAIDFTRENNPEGERGVVIYSYMAHHQGMTLLAIDNVLHGSAMQRRFHDDRRIRAFESLLFERVPATRIPLDELQTVAPPIRAAMPLEPAERTWKEDTAIPRVQLHGNGRYALMVTNSGGGYSRWNEFDLTRWRSDTTLDPWGSFLYIRDLRSDEIWSAAHQPVGGSLGIASARFTADRAEFQRRVSGVETVLAVTVAAEDDVELRRVTITNRSLRSRQMELTSYAELALAPHASDKAHPAFSKMFVETERLDDTCLLAHRRLRSPDEPPIWAAHLLLGRTGDVQCETDRAQFLGRGNTLEHPAALRQDLSGSVGAVLDPIFSLRCRVTIEPRDRLEITFLTLAASSRDALLALIAKYRRSEAVARAFEMAWTRGQLEFRFLGIGPAAAHRFQDLASHLLYPNPRLRPLPDRLSRNRLGQSALWAYGISGDLPILVALAPDGRSLPLVREALRAHAYWRLRGFQSDLVILNQESSSYDRPLQQQLLQQIEAHSPGAAIDKPGGVFLRDWNAIPEDSRTLILATACVVLNGSRGPLQQQLASARETIAPPAFAATGEHEEPSQPLPFLELPYFNGLGGFTPDGREYAIYLQPGAETPTPWVNVMANAQFGAIVSESGLGSTWHVNSQANRLTPWHNDPVGDPQSEIIYLRDEETGALWTPTALPIREADAYRARHGQGYTAFEHNSHAIGVELTVFVPAAADGGGDPVKVYRLRLRNDSSHPRRLTATYFAEWVLGAERENQQLHVQTSHDESSGAILGRQFWSGGETRQIAFAASSPRAASYTCDRTQFLGRNGSKAHPAALGRVTLDNRSGAGLDPAAALQIPVRIEPGAQVEVVFLLGEAGDLDTVRSIVSRYQNHDDVENALRSTREAWDVMLDALQAHTPLLSTNFLLNRWLVYQTLSCRFWGRTALYQSSGAFGFRDQLQDSMAFTIAAPAVARAHILASAARQFPEGDVQHWWHADTGAGVRTRCSDDLVWLPYVVAHFVETTGDTGILDEEVTFVEGALLAAGEHEKFFAPTVSQYTAPLWDHCRRALEHAAPVGAHRLPLMGNGDWNDGMNRVGIEGRGESVWLGWFLNTTLKAFARVMENRPSGEALAAEWRARAAALADAIESSSWDGDWYLRAFFDNGAPIGSHVNEEARIDSLPQSWAVISGDADPERARRAMESARHFLVDESDHLVRLFTPPFDHSQPNPGYIMGYPPGMRENGGQYTHGSLWLAMACARMGDGEAAVHLLKSMSPVELSRHPEDVARYRGEPYVASADVSDAPGKAGRSGWTWYSGSAGWMYRVWIEEVLGFQLRGDLLTLNPAIPDDWPGFEIRYRYRSSVYEIAVLRNPAGAPTELEVDGELITGGAVRLVDDGKTHPVTLRVPRRAPQPSGRPAAPAPTPANGAFPLKAGSEKTPLRAGSQ